MDTLKQQLIQISDKVLNKLLDFRKSNPSFTFALRERDSVQSEEIRLEAGQWFQGSHYIYVPFFSKGDTARKIKTLGFVIGFDEDGEIESNKIEISFKGGIDNDNEKAFHRKLATKLKIDLNDNNHGVVYYPDGSNYLENLDDYLNRVYPLAIQLLDEFGLKDKYVIPEATFLARLARINEIKKRLSNNVDYASGVTKEINRDHLPKNIILYGPPGTGKTYNSIDLAVSIATNKSSDHKSNKEVFDRLRGTGQIEFVTFHQNYTYENFITGITPDIQSAQLRFVQQDGVFKRIVDKAKENWLKSRSEQNLPVDFDSVFNAYFEQLIQEEVKEVEIPMKSKGYKFKITSISFDDGRIKFTKQSGGTGHDLLIRHVKGLYEGTMTYAAEGLGVYYFPLVDQLLDYAQSILHGTAKKEELKKYVLIIDEINRANISKVFGEIITLLEEDKRLGCENELRVTLPTGEAFVVPQNLYVIGTMNTADKSIALVDIALRRRFEFEAKYPDYTAIKDTQASDLLRRINKTVYEKKKSADYLIGHAYFINHSSIENVLEKKVIPLLSEYFMGRTDFVKEVFEGTGWNVDYNTENFRWVIKYNGTV